ncbi:hypothetical protein BDW02DRAFT_643366 [Decorospora gaudefroyi]|uniref:Uncharacterized protein n=1 Tax=Decorospora gaudefroyi TaxID=184978 RepID=A0A6A5K594_9PLEO|nr:hypothetical protein BDW02DRAFT_643366 [Decorospora gaudefroyi]
MLDMDVEAKEGNKRAESEFLTDNLLSDDLERIATHLWIMTTTSSANVNPLHHQRVKGRLIVVTEDCRLHLVWIHYHIFIKSVPRYLLSYAFWETHLDQKPGSLNFRIAQQDRLRLVSNDIDWASFRQFTGDLSPIEDAAVSRRYCFGELILARLNFYAPLLLRKFYFEQVHRQYGDYFTRLYCPMLFVFAAVSAILNSMQVALAADQPMAVHRASTSGCTPQDEN